MSSLVRISVLGDHDAMAEGNDERIPGASTMLLRH
jgi:hypothetical protein